MRDLFGTRLELRLGDPMDSEIDRKIAQLVPTGRPGRGLVQQKLHFLGALPRIDSDARRREPRRRRRATWSPGSPRPGRARAGPKLRLLPDEIELAAVRKQAGVDDIDGEGGGPLLLGINEKDLGPVVLDPDADAAPAGPRRRPVRQERGAARATRRRSCAPGRPTQAQIVVVDYRRSLLGEMPEEYLLNYLTSAKDTGPALSDIATYLENRIPGPRRHPRPAAQPLVVDGRRGLRARRRLRPGRHPVRAPRCRRCTR